jgi:hypothetical protein
MGGRSMPLSGEHLSKACAKTEDQAQAPDRERLIAV